MEFKKTKNTFIHIDVFALWTFESEITANFSLSTIDKTILSLTSFFVFLKNATWDRFQQIATLTSLIALSAYQWQGRKKIVKNSSSSLKCRSVASCKSVRRSLKACSLISGVSRSSFLANSNNSSDSGITSMSNGANFDILLLEELSTEPYTLLVVELFR